MQPKEVTPPCINSPLWHISTYKFYQTRTSDELERIRYNVATRYIVRHIAGEDFYPRRDMNYYFELDAWFEARITQLKELNL